MDTRLIIVVTATVFACSTSKSGLGDAPLADAAAACPACPEQPACPEPEPGPACERIDAFVFFASARIVRGRTLGDVFVRAKIHRADGWYDAALFGAEEGNANSRLVSDVFPYGDDLIRHGRARPDNVGQVSINEMTHYQDRRALIMYGYNPPEGGGPDREFMVSIFRLLE